MSFDRVNHVSANVVVPGWMSSPMIRLIAPNQSRNNWHQLMTIEEAEIAIEKMKMAVAEARARMGGEG